MGVQWIAPPIISFTFLSCRECRSASTNTSISIPHTSLLIADHNIHRHPTVSEASTLKSIPAQVPITAYFLALVEFAERASYYGVSGVFTNFVQRPLPPGSTTGAPAPGSEVAPGALGMGLRASATVSALFTVMAFASPLVSSERRSRDLALTFVHDGEMGLTAGGRRARGRAMGQVQDYRPRDCCVWKRSRTLRVG